jgi:hypothetical protein
MPIQDAYFSEIPGPRHACLTTPRVKHIVRIYRAFPKSGLPQGWGVALASRGAPGTGLKARAGDAEKRGGPGVEPSEPPHYQRETERHWMECLATLQPKSDLGRLYLPSGAVQVFLPRVNCSSLGGSLHTCHGIATSDSLPTFIRILGTREEPCSDIYDTTRNWFGYI